MPSFKKNYLTIALLTVGLLILSSCELDNYEEPDKVLQGNVVDEETGENIQTRQPDGIKIRLLEEGFENPVPYDFWAQSDGSFRNERIFDARYTVIALEGPFEQSSVEEEAVDLTQTSVDNVTFEVMPYVRLSDVEINKSGTGGISATYRLSSTQGDRKILESMLIAYTSPILHQNTTNKLSSAIHDLSDTPNSDIATMIFEDEISGLEEGETYYARVAVLAENTLDRYNYSPIIELEF